MENSEQPINPQSENWQNDMEKHLSMPEKYGNPSLSGIGLTKREYFAGIAMQGLLGNFLENGHYYNSSHTPMVSEIAVKCADELLKELENGKL
tara:strand:- start:294 stop:572 length:279 start_codon:yes stop_codon:yes gene_type:complete